MKQKIILLVAILSGLLAFWLTGAYLQNEREKILSGVRKVWVVVAERDLPRGSTIKETDLAKDEIFERNLNGREIEPELVNQLYGKKLLFSIQRGVALLWSDVGISFKKDISLSDTINPRMRAISIAVDAVSSVSAMIRPNDHIDILGTFAFPSAGGTGKVETVTLTILQDVTVLATGQAMARKATLTGKPKRAQRGYSTITLEVTPREAELLIFAQSTRGRLSMSLRNPTDVSFTRLLPAVNFDELQKKLPEINLYRQRNIRYKKDTDF